MQSRSIGYVVTAQQVLAAWLREKIAPALRDAGYKGSGQNFYCRLGRNWGLINFQRSQRDWAERATFTVNLGTSSAIVLEGRGEDPDRPPIVWDGQWWERLGSLLGGRDRWWEIRDDADAGRLSDLATEVRTALADHGLPAIREHASDEAILDAVLRDNRRGFGQVDVAGVLLAALGGTPEQRRTFTSLVTTTRTWMLEHDIDLRPRQGPKRTAANLALLSDARVERRANAAHELGRAEAAPEVLAALRDCLSDESPRVRIKAGCSLAELGDLASVDRLLADLRHEPHRFLAVELGDALVKLALREPGVRTRLVPVVQERLSRAVGIEVPGFEAILVRLAP